MEQFVKTLKKGVFQPIYVIHGNDDYLLNYAKELLKEHIIPKDEQELNVSVYNMLDTPLSVALEEADSFPFFGNQKVVVLDNAYFLSSEKAKGIEQNITELESYIANPNPDTILALIVPTKLDKRKAIVKKVMGLARSVDVSPMNDDRLKKFIADYVKQHNFSIEKEALQEIISRTNAKLSIIINELHKLFIVVSHNHLIDLNSVKQSVVQSLESNIFALSEYIEKRDLNKALHVFNDLLLQGEEPVKLLAILLSQYRLHLQVSLLQQEGYSGSDIAKYLNQHPYRIQQTLKQVRKYSLQQLKTIYNELAYTDWQLKTSAMNKQLIMELAIIKIIKGF